jgi:hypothetical protein
MIKSGENQEAAMALFTVIILSIYLKRMRKNMKRVDCHDALPTTIPRAFLVKDIASQCSP